MISTLVLAFHLMGYVSASKASTFLYLTGIMMIIAEVGLPTFGIAGFNGVLALAIGYAIQSGASSFLGIPVDWGLWFGIAFTEFLLLFLIVTMFARHRKRKATTGVESMIGEKAAVLEWDGQKGVVRIQGETWKARSESPLEMPPESAVTVRAVEGMVLLVEA